MKNNNLIIDVRKQLPWQKRYISNTSTAFMWAIWLLLWRPALLVMGVISLQKHHVLEHLFGTLGLGVEHGFTALIICAITLLLWSKYMPAKTVKKQHDIETLSHYAQYFDLSEQSLIKSRVQKVSTVHHDEMGCITHID